MRLFSRILLLFPALCLVGYSGSGGSEPQQGTLKAYAQKAKADGKHSIFIAAPSGIFAHLSSLNEALSTYSAFVVVPEASKIVPAEGTSILTWYKLRIIEEVKLHPRPDEESVEIPDDFLPRRANDLVVRLHGGALLIDGIEVLEEYSPIPALKLGART